MSRFLMVHCVNSTDMELAHE